MELLKRYTKLNHFALKSKLDLNRPLLARYQVLLGNRWYAKPGRSG